jgi:hypothetical protein
MKIAFILPGVAIAAVGFALLFIQLALAGAPDMASGKAGGRSKVLLTVAIALMFFGSCGAFVGVAASDSGRRKACQRSCTERGYTEGKITASSKPLPPEERRIQGPICRCAGGAHDPVEIEITEP